MRMRSERRVPCFVALIFAVVGMASSGFAQVESGTINGTVVDSSGALGAC